MNRELDAQIAEKIFGLQVIHDWPCGYQLDGCGFQAASAVLDSEYWAVEPFVPEPRWLESYDERHPCTPWPRHSTGRTSGLYPVPFYSTKFAAAWSIVEELAKRGFTGNVQRKGAGREYQFTAEASFQRWADGLTVGYAFDATAPLAICRAALRAVADPLVIGAI